MADKDNERADSRDSKPRPSYGKTGYQTINKCREQTKLGEYPKRRSDDEY